MNPIEQTDWQEPGWQTLGKLEIAVEASMEDEIRAWMVELLLPLNLSTEFYNRFLRSAQASARRALGANLSSRLTHIHLSILVQHKQSPKGKSWGFFQIERTGNHSGDVAAGEHAIDFYLYIEGD
jgi:hypothetical protein